jgi:hypothetical protein
MAFFGPYIHASFGRMEVNQVARYRTAADVVRLAIMGVLLTKTEVSNAKASLGNVTFTVNRLHRIHHLHLRVLYEKGKEIKLL